jgi:hypothetical protein
MATAFRHDQVAVIYKITYTLYQSSGTSQTSGSAWKGAFQKKVPRDGQTDSCGTDRLLAPFYSGNYIIADTEDGGGAFFHFEYLNKSSVTVTVTVKHSVT